MIKVYVWKWNLPWERDITPIFQTDSYYMNYDCWNWILIQYSQRVMPKVNDVRYYILLEKK